ncbi:MAG: putative hemolysin [Roseibaca calidilacus]|uniref:L-ornithine N(alpha)-acyltransferase n=1 Tax=Roseibaca calidilacus TaxID=1666912 RepID=A0A0P7WP36_9RHOB|nr:GNAT family N-acetyltransferase [Roseibaca calidilacus]KPP95762.1 MAG: putative hemolysin [Roseibaca calidilacus]CUX81749.1 Putative hemolysin [Roseibaca calidilacus]
MAMASRFPDHKFGRLTLRIARDDADLAQVAQLRRVRFRDNRGADMDQFDPLCAHLLVVEGDDPAALACARLRLLDGPELDDCYSAQFYDLSPLARAGLRGLELGRVCIASDRRQDPDILRALLAGIALHSDAEKVDLLLGCASFKGDDPARHAAALGWLKARHTGPSGLCPLKRAPLAFDLPMPGDLADQKAAMQSIPPLLRLYLGLGGWVSDHAVRDPNLDTLHVFTAVEVARIPTARKKLLMGMTQPR